MRLLAAIIVIIVIIVVASSPGRTHAQDSNHFFCGTSWDDASNNCDERQHCPTGTDDECNGGTTGAPASLRRRHGRSLGKLRGGGGGREMQSATATSLNSGGGGILVCFGGTTCDSRLGHGAMFKYANLPYEDISNTRFCGADWNAALGGCR
jgi:hypothetical protein